MIKFKFNVGQYNNAIDTTSPAMNPKKVGSEEVKSYFYFTIVRSEDKRRGYCIFVASNSFSQLTSYMQIDHIEGSDEELDDKTFFLSAKDCLKVAAAVNGMDEDGSLEISKEVKFKCRGHKLTIERTPEVVFNDEGADAEPISIVTIKNENLASFKKHLLIGGTMYSGEAGELTNNVYIGINKNKVLQIASMDGYISAAGEFDKIEEIKQEQDLIQVLVPGSDFKSFFKYVEDYKTDLQIVVHPDKLIFCNGVINMAIVKTVDGNYFYKQLKAFISPERPIVHMKVNRNELMKACDMIEVHAGTSKAYTECTLKKNGKWYLDAAMKKCQSILNVETDDGLDMIALDESFLRKIIKRTEGPKICIEFDKNGNISIPIIIKSEGNDNIYHMLSLMKPKSNTAVEEKEAKQK